MNINFKTATKSLPLDNNYLQSDEQEEVLSRPANFLTEKSQSYIPLVGPSPPACTLRLHQKSHEPLLSSPF